VKSARSNVIEWGTTRTFPQCRQPLEVIVAPRCGRRLEQIAGSEAVQPPVERNQRRSARDSTPKRNGIESAPTPTKECECDIHPDGSAQSRVIELAQRSRNDTQSIRVGFGALAGPVEVLVSSTVKELVIGSAITVRDAVQLGVKGVPTPGCSSLCGNVHIPGVSRTQRRMGGDRPMISVITTVGHAGPPRGATRWSWRQELTAKRRCSFCSFG
jgi:hypothetical protein